MVMFTGASSRDRSGQIRSNPDPSVCGPQGAIQPAPPPGRATGPSGGAGEGTPNGGGRSYHRHTLVSTDAIAVNTAQSFTGAAPKHGPQSRNQQAENGGISVAIDRQHHQSP
jgi:hypothetical protein